MPGEKDDRPCCRVKFCGGCNPRYDRRAAYETIRAAFEDALSFEFETGSGDCDVLLYVAGCVNRCTTLPRGETVETVTIWGEETIEEAADALRRFCARGASAVSEE